MKPLVYLAGAIRDGRKEDIEWREEVIFRCEGLATFINPLGGKVYHSESKRWTLHDHLPSSARFIVSQDFWAVDHVDIIVFNFLALSEGYPNIGTLVEFGRSTSRPILRYGIISPRYTGHENGAMYHLHPFIEENLTARFDCVAECVAFLEDHLSVLSGDTPSFRGVVAD